VTRCKTTVILTLFVLAAVVPLVAAPHDAAASPLHARLVAARHRLSRVSTHLAEARAALTAALAAPVPLATPEPSGGATPEASASTTPDPSTSATPAAAVAGPTLDELKARVARLKLVVRRVDRTVRRLTRQYRLERKLAAWERRGMWTPIIRYAARRYGVSPAGVRRMMMLESRGHRYAGSSSSFKGLFQYSPATWRARWNPWRGEGIYDGSSQIFATCYALHHGFGPRMWPNTYPIAF
jgi:hypothetical protein